jgi:hypothetical protein
MTIPTVSATHAANLLAWGLPARLRHRRGVLDLSPARYAQHNAYPYQALVWWEGLPTICVVDVAVVGLLLVGWLPSLTQRKLPCGRRSTKQCYQIPWSQVIGLGVDKTT